MKILLTGGNGFIGKNIIKNLGDNYSILAPSSRELNLLDSSAVSKYVQKNKPEIIIHSASIGLDLEESTDNNIVEKNLSMFINLFNNKKYYKRMINLGSGAEYDKSKNIVMVKEDETDFFVPNEKYAFSKYVMSKIAKNDDKLIHIRLFGVFGEHENYLRRFISNAICTALLDLPIIINRNVIFDYLYVNDFTFILDNFVKKKKLKYNIYNVGRGKSVDLVTISKIILTTLDKSLEIKILKKGFNKEYTCNVSRLKKEFDNLQYTELEDAIRDLSNYYKNIINTLDKKLFIKKYEG